MAPDFACDTPANDVEHLCQAIFTSNHKWQSYAPDKHFLISKDAIWFMHSTGIFSNLWPLIVTLTFEVWTRNMRATLRLMMLNIIVKRFLIPSTNSRVMLRTSKSGRTDRRTDRRTESAKSKCLPHKVGDINKQSWCTIMHSFWTNNNHFLYIWYLCLVSTPKVITLIILVQINTK